MFSEVVLTLLKKVSGQRPSKKFPKEDKVKDKTVVSTIRSCLQVYFNIPQHFVWNFLNIILFSEILHFSTSFILKFNDNFNNCLVKDSIPEEVNNSYIGLSKNKFSWKYNQHYSSYSNENYNPFNPLARKNRIQNTYGPLRSRSVSYITVHCTVNQKKLWNLKFTQFLLLVCLFLLFSCP